MEANNKKLKIYHVQGWKEYSNWIPNVQHVNNVDDADIVFFLGGEDVSPDIYGQPKHRRTHCDPDRDRLEKRIYDKAVEQGKKILGVCRGSQFLCAMQPGGLLVQDQNNPGYHLMKTYDGKELRVSSTHHQAQYPFNLKADEYKVLGWTEGMLKYHEDGNEEELNPPKECEIVFYPKANALGIQLHPEMLPYESETNEWLRGQLDKFLNNEL